MVRLFFYAHAQEFMKIFRHRTIDFQFENSDFEKFKDICITPARNEVNQIQIAAEILNDSLNMSVVMRSNDLWFGFCNDQYCFSMLQKMIAETLRIDVGTYYHFAQNFHIYNKQIEDYG